MGTFGIEREQQGTGKGIHPAEHRASAPGSRRIDADTRLLWGGRISILERSPAAVARVLKRDIAHVYPQLDVKIDFAWNGLMSYARHEMPQLGQLGPGLWYAQAFGGHGVATTTAVGELLAAAIADGDDNWRRFSRFGLPPTYRPFGLLGAQAKYWWLQGRDAWAARG